MSCPYRTGARSIADRGIRGAALRPRIGDRFLAEFALHWQGSPTAVVELSTASSLLVRRRFGWPRNRRRAVIAGFKIGARTSGQETFNFRELIFTRGRISQE